MAASNSSACATYGNCTILDGADVNGTMFVTGYDASAPVPYWHQRMELATICICNSLSLIIIVMRVAYRWSWLHRFRGDDRWAAAAGIILLGYFASQIGTSMYGSGLYMKNVENGWLEMHWQFELGWAGYYIITSLIKISVCFTFLEILPHHRMAMRYTVYGLATFIGLLGLALTIAWTFQCTPFLSNFIWSINATSCVNYDIFRWMWIGLSIPIDLVIVAVPLRILNQTRMPERERKILTLVFSANLLGTITCILGIYGVFETRVTESNEGFYHETAFIMMNDIEILMYVVGASFPVLSRHLFSRTNPTRDAHSNFSSWARHIPDFFHPETSHTRVNRPAGSTATCIRSPMSEHSPDQIDQEKAEIFDLVNKSKSPVTSISPSNEQA